MTTPGRVEVVLRRYPVAQSRAVVTYYRSLFRELVLIAAAEPVDSGSAPARLRSLVREARDRYREIGLAWSHHVRAARVGGRAEVDVVLPLVPAAREHALRLGHLLREVDRYARRGL